MEYYCETCKKTYASYQSLWIHNKKYHKEQTQSKENANESNNKNKCVYCNKIFTYYQSKWRHEKKCEKQNITNDLVNKIKRIEKEMNILKTEPKINNITNINKGVINNFFTKPGSESINTLNEKEIEYILDQELNSVIRVIEVLNFSPDTPENHTFCSTALNDKHINVINPETTQVEKKIKKEFIEQLLYPGINKVKMLYEKIDLKNPKKQKYNEKIDNLVKSLIINNKGRKVFVDAINVLTYNNRHKVLLTWEQIKQGKIPDTKFVTDTDVKQVPIIQKILEYSDSEFSTDSDDDFNADEESELIKIQYKKNFYYLDNNMLYEITDGKKGKLFAHYLNGKVVIINEKEIVL